MKFTASIVIWKFDNLFFCLLSRTCQLSDFPEIHDWEAYMDTSKIECFKMIDTADILLNHVFGHELLRGKTGGLREFPNRYR